MKKAKAPNLQFKLALDEGLKKTWLLLEQEYQALDKASIIRLALNTLAKQTTAKEYLDYSIDKILDEIESRDEGMTEKEFFQWWNKNKPFNK
ncbi:hypothetical protein HY357_00205 [Candidatus Roizmanbacteria bacterium]|nr:hypothetical protein [Candidatus Roizmanbacteria bacterium]